MNDEKRKIRKYIIGWREWVGLPDVGIERLKAKIDTGAKSSCLHAIEQHYFQKQDQQWVRFKVAISRNNVSKFIESEAPIVEFRQVKSSNGQSAKRPVIVTTVELREKKFEIEVTLADRKEMGFRMLLGREAIMSRFLVDCSRSYIGGKPKIHLPEMSDSMSEISNATRSENSPVTGHQQEDSTQ